MKKSLLLLVVVFILSLSGVCQLTLEQCWDIALNRNELIKSEKLNLTMANVENSFLIQSKMPTISGNVGHGYNWGRTVDQFTNEFVSTRTQSDYLSVSGNLILFDGLNSYYQQKSNSISSKEAQLNLEGVKREIKKEIAIHYYDMVLFIKLNDLYSRTLSRKEAQLEILKRKSDVVKGEELTILETESQIQRYLLKIKKNQNELLKTKLILSTVINLNVDSLEVDTTLISLPIIRNSPDNTNVDKLELSVDQANLKMDHATFSRLPSITLSSSLGTGFSGNHMVMEGSNLIIKPFGDQLQSNFHQSLFIRMSLPVLNQGQVKFHRQKAQIELEKSILNYELQSKQKRINNILAIQKILDLQEDLNSLYLILEISAKSLELAELKLRLSTISRLEYYNFENSFYKDQENYIFAQIKLFKQITIQNIGE